MNKRAQEEVSYETILELVMIGLMVILLLTSVQAVRDNSVHNGQALARDMGLVYDSMRAVQGTANFPLKSKIGFSVAINPECKISVAQKGKENAPQIFFCGQTEGQRIKITEQLKENGATVYVLQRD